ncbi:MAG TPA: hypothetical protein VF831_00775 [Anaerolineales bacterium]
MAKAVDDQYLGLIRRLVDRLERLSADSTYAHRASGLRGSLLLYLECIEAGDSVNKIELDDLIEDGFEILKAAAEEIGGSE